MWDSTLTLVITPHLPSCADIDLFDIITTPILATIATLIRQLLVSITECLIIRRLLIRRLLIQSLIRLLVM